VTLFWWLSDTVHSVKSPGAEKCVLLHVDTAFAAGKGSEDSSPCKPCRPVWRLSCGRAARLKGLLTPHQLQMPFLVSWPDFFWGRILTLPIYSPTTQIPERKIKRVKPTELLCLLVPSATGSILQSSFRRVDAKCRPRSDHAMGESVQPPGK